MKTKLPTIKLPSSLPASVAVAFLATLLALPVQAALTLPQVPPKSGNGVAPNIVIILDDSGSMSMNGGVLMPVADFNISGSGYVAQSDGGDNVYGEDQDGVNISGDDGDRERDIRDFAYTSNSLYYNPAVTYLPWRIATGGLMASTPYDSAFQDLDLASGARVNLGQKNRAFHVPKGGTVDKTLAVNYYRYQFKSDGTADRCEWTQVTTQNPAWDWRSCIVVATFSWGRNLAEEKANFANWFSYHRTRIKAAKAGVGSAFGDLGTNLRVGLDSLHNNSGATRRRIPVATDDGLFRDFGTSTNRSNWYQSLYGATGSNVTPLRDALKRTGDYFSETGADGPYGPQTGAAQLSCRQNFAILTTDGFWNNDTGDFSGLSGDEDAGVTVTGPNSAGPNGATYTYVPARPYNADAGGNTRQGTLADVAMHYWKTDLRALLNNVPVTAANPAFWQHMVTFGISFGVRGTLDPKADLAELTGGTKFWPNPLDDPGLGTEDRIDDLWHAAVNGRGNFVSASSPGEFTSGLKDALATITNRTSSSSNVAANSTSLGTDTRLFQASYIGGQWTGELRAFPVTPAIPANPGATPPTPAKPAKIGDTAIWSASEEIPAWDARKIFTHNGSTGATFPTTAQLVTLEAGLGTGLELANYLKGDDSKEMRKAGVFRNRLHLLGDIIHSSPVYVKDSDTIFVGANDGMLHAFDGSSGGEQFAYIPAGVNIANLAKLGDPGYPHNYFADGPLTVSTKTQTPNKNILVASLGRGGKGLYALDVTAPGSFAVGDVEWDISGDADMGHILGEPFITKLNGGEGTGVIVANGFNSPNDTAVLLVVDIDDGRIIKRIPTSSATSNGLFGPRGWDNDGNGTVDFVYASDLLGNVWKFDLNGNSNQWDVAYKQGNTPLPLFVATDATGNRQAITGGISIAIDPETYKQWIFFGTGRYLTSDDPADPSVQTMYGIIDGGVPIGTRAANDDPNSANGLVKRTTVAAGNINGMPVRGFEASTQPLPVGKRGWFVDFAPPAPGTALGERMVGKPAVVGPVLLFSSIIPSSDPCTPGGRGFINAINPFTGASVGSHFFDVDGDGQYGDDEVGGVPVGSVDTGVGMNTDALLIEKLITVGGSGGNTGSVGVSNPAALGRVSWRELIRD